MRTTGTDQFGQLASMYRLLAHPVRLKILYLLHRHPMAVCHIEAIVKQRQAYLSQQLGILREEGLIACERNGWHIYYHIVDPEIFAILNSTEKLLQLDLDMDQYQLDVNTECGCPSCQEASGKEDCLPMESNERSSVI